MRALTTVDVGKIRERLFFSPVLHLTQPVVLVNRNCYYLPWKTRVRRLNELKQEIQLMSHRYCSIGIPIIDKSDENQSHWVCLYIHNGSLSYFNSLGESVSETLLFFIDRLLPFQFRQHIQLRNRELQKGTVSCGHWMLWYLYERAVQLHSHQTLIMSKKNDNQIMTLMNKKLGI